MRSPLLRRAALVLVLPLVFATGPSGDHARAEGSRAPKGGVFPSVEEVTDEAAAPLVEALERAVESGGVEAMTRAITPMVTGRNEKFNDPLRPLLNHKEESVACLAASALASQGERGTATLLAKILKAKPSNEEKKNNCWSRGLLRAASIEAMGRLGVSSLYEDIRRHADAVVDTEVETPYAGEMLKSCVRYFGLTKEKRAVSFLIEQFDKPESPEVVTGTTPPAEWWKARQESWQVAEPEVAWALKEITGLEHETGRRWRNWFKENGKKLGLK